MTVTVNVKLTEDYETTIKQLVVAYYMLAAKSADEKAKAVKELKRLGITINESEELK